MEKLLSYINSLPDWKQLELAQSCESSIGYLRKAISARQKLGAEICNAIEQATNGEVTRKDLRPNDFWKIWPDLSREKEGV